MSNPWFRTYTEMVDDEKLRLLAFEDRWHFVALLCCKGKGILDEPGRSLARRKVAVKLGVDLATLDEIARRLAEVDLIDEKSLQPKAWTKRQFESDNSTERVRKYRKNKDPCNVSSPFHDRFAAVSETPPEAEAEADTDTEKNRTITPLPPAVDSPDFPFGKSVESPAGGSAPSSADSDLLGEAPPAPAKKSKGKKLNGALFQSVVDAFHEILPELPSVRVPTDDRVKSVMVLADCRLGSNAGLDCGLGDDIEDWRAYFRAIRKDDFIMGRKPGKDGTPFKASFDYILRPAVFARVTERRSS